MGAAHLNVLVVENWPHATLGLVGDALAEAHAACHVARTHEGQALPGSARDFDALVLLGGAQDALDDANYPFLRDEMALVRSFAEADRPVLGICLGAQIVARAFGARNILGRPIEFGWHPVRTTARGRADPVLSAIGEAAPTFHWHLDTFTLPRGAVHLAASDQTSNQAFRIGRAVYGIQFHFEVDRPMVETWNDVYAEEIRDFDPGWFERHPAEAEKHGLAADAAGLSLARAWTSLIAPASQKRPAPARDASSQTAPEYPA
jgi:GMP synthase-like glutamine amidotransferase